MGTSGSAARFAWVWEHEGVTESSTIQRDAPGDRRVPRDPATTISLAMVTILAAGALIGGSYLGVVGLLVALAAVQSVLVVSWVLGTALPGRIGGLILGVLAAGAADAAVMRWHDSGYQPVLAVLGVALPVMFIHQLTRGVVRTRVVESLAHIALMILAVTAASGLIVLRYQVNGDKTTLAVVGALAGGLIVNHLTDLVLPAPRFDPTINRGLPAVITGIAAGAAVGVLTLNEIIDFTRGRAAFLGGAVAAVACLISIGTSFAGTHTTLTPAPQPDEPSDGLRLRPVPVDAGPGDDAVGQARGGARLADPDVVPLPETDLPEVEIGPWRGVPRLRPVAASLVTVALTSPAGYVLVTALTG